MSSQVYQEWLINAVFWVVVIFGTHYLFIRKRCHPGWVPWKATVSFFWNLAWPVLLATFILVMAFPLIGAIGGDTVKGATGSLASVFALLVVFPAFWKAKRIIQGPPCHQGPVSDKAAERWECEAEGRREQSRSFKQARRTLRCEQAGKTLGHWFGKWKRDV